MSHIPYVPRLQPGDELPILDVEDWIDIDWGTVDDQPADPETDD